MNVEDNFSIILSKKVFFKHMKLSILITNYNKSELVDRAIRSVENQLLIRHNVEIIVVDDASSDSPQLWLDKHQSLDRSVEIKVIYLKNNIGVAGASNVAFESSSGDLIMRLDADDYLSQAYSEVACDLLDYNQCYGYVFTDIVGVDEYGNQQRVIERSNWENLLEYGAGVVLRRSVT